MAGNQDETCIDAGTSEPEVLRKVAISTVSRYQRMPPRDGPVEMYRGLYTEQEAQHKEEDRTMMEEEAEESWQEVEEVQL